VRTQRGMADTHPGLCDIERMHDGPVMFLDTAACEGSQDTEVKATKQEARDCLPVQTRVTVCQKSTGHKRRAHGEIEEPLPRERFQKC
jgi:hypothetical protein